MLNPSTGEKLKTKVMQGVGEKITEEQAVQVLMQGRSVYAVPKRSTFASCDEENDMEYYPVRPKVREKGWYFVVETFDGEGLFEFSDPEAALEMAIVNADAIQHRYDRNSVLGRV